MSVADDGWAAYVRDLLEAKYLAGDNARAQSGFGGDAAYWDIARGVIAEAIDRPGAFLDVGCANGHLMECMVEWCAARGVEIEPYGLDIIPSMVDLARSRLPQWRDRIVCGDARTWEPPRRFDFVRTELLYAPDNEQELLVAHLLDTVVAPGGRLIVCAYGSRTLPDQRAADLTERLESWGHTVAGRCTAVVGDRVTTWVGWIQLPNSFGRS
jgi:trans-aconitate methyltransferase